MDFITTRFDRHHIRTTFYHAGFITFLMFSLANYTGRVGDAVFQYFTIGLIVVDYIAEMYDPHPDVPGPWLQSHFHRFFEVV